MTLRVASAVFAAVTAFGAMGAIPAPDERPPFLVAFDADTGETRWRVSVGDRPGHLGVKYTLGGMVYGVRIRCGIDLNPSFVALDADTGKERWRVRVGDDLAVGVERSAVVVVDRDDALRGLDPKSGTVRWKRDLEGFSPTGGNRDLVLVWRWDAEGGVVRGLDRRTGRIRWEYPFRGTAGHTVADDDTVVLAVGPPRATATTSPVFALHVLDARTGTQKNQFGVPYLPDGVDVSGSVVAVATASVVNGYDAVTGEHLWAASGRLAPAQGRPSGLLVLRRAPGDTTSPAYTVLDASTGAPLTPITTSSQGGFDVDDQMFALTEVEERGEGLRTRVRALELPTGTELWRRTIDSSVDVAIGPDAVYAGGGCETAP